MKHAARKVHALLIMDTNVARSPGARCWISAYFAGQQNSCESVAEARMPAVGAPRTPKVGADHANSCGGLPSTARSLRAASLGR
jgi:hypothetical protein